MKPFILSAMAVVILSSCLPVPFDLGLSQSAAATKKMTLDNASLITLSGGTDPSAHDFAFYPQILAGGPDYTNGFVLFQRNLDLQIEAVKQGTTPWSYFSYSRQLVTIANPDPHAPPYTAWPLRTGPSYLLGMAFDAVDPFNANRCALFWGDPGTNTLNIQNPPATMFDRVSSFPPNIFNLAVIGGSVFAGSAGNDYLHWLGKNTGVSDNYIELTYPVSSAGFAPAVEPRGVSWYSLPFVPDAGTRVTYFFDDNPGADPVRSPNRSFASWWDMGSGSWVAYAWEGPIGSPPTQNMQLPINHRIDALLSTGQLLSTENGTGRLYDRDGNLLATFPLGSLVYLGEHYVGGVPRCYFSQSLAFDHTQHFNVYWIRTDQLGTLTY